MASVSFLALRPTARTLRWPLLALFGAAASVMVWGGGRKGGDPLAYHLPAAGVLLAVWLAFQMADAAETTLSSSPTSLVRRRLLRTVPSMVAIFALWAALLLQANSGAKTGTLSAFFAAVVCVAAASSAMGERAIGPNRGGPVAIAMLFSVFVLMPAILRVPLPVDPATDGWMHLYGRWLLIGGGGVIVFLVVCLDPARRVPR